MLSLSLFFFGILASGFALLVELLVSGIVPAISTLSQEPFSFSTFLSLVCLASIEEVSKYLFLSQYIRRFSPSLPSSWKHSFWLGALFGIGFAAPETFLATGAFSSAPLLAFPSMITVHIITSILFAVFLFSSLYRSLTGSKRHLLASYLIASAILLHTLYNMYVFLFV